MTYLLGLIAALVGGLFFYRTKAKSAEALNANTETKEALVKEDGAIAANTGRIEAEQERIKDIQTTADNELKKGQSNEDLARFLDDFAKRNKSKN